MKISPDIEFLPPPPEGEQYSEMETAVAIKNSCVCVLQRFVGDEQPHRRIYLTPEGAERMAQQLIDTAARLRQRLAETGYPSPSG